MVTDEQIQRQIAKLRGAEWLYSHELGYHVWLFNDGTIHQSRALPNWPTDRNDSKDLLVKDQHNFNVALVKITDERGVTDIEVGRASAELESLAWILSEHGYSWDECDSCEGEPHGVSEDCTDCSGEGGKWRKA